MKAFVDHGDYCTSPYRDEEVITFVQLFNRFPALRWLYPLQVENSWNGDEWAMALLNYSKLPVYFSIAYFVLIFGGQYIMKDKKPFDLKWPLAFWNLALAIFSFIGAVRVVPHLLVMIFDNGYENAVCTPVVYSYGMGAAAIWVELFIFSKVPELLDTAFIVLRKKPLIFLHWYHHITVLLFCWYAGAHRASIGIFFCAMNFSVHAIMYFYYFASCVGIWPKWISPFFITLCQLSQMFVGVIVTVSAIYFKQNGQCDSSNDVLFWGGLMYLSYFSLFFKFLIDRFFPSKKRVVPNSSKLEKVAEQKVKDVKQD